VKRRNTVGTMFKSTLGLVLLLCLVGCRSTPKENVPTFALTSIEESRHILAKRARHTHNVMAEGTVTLVSRDGKDVRLDSAVALELPERARIRAYKLGQAVFDLTMTREFVYLYAPRADEKSDLEKAGANAGEMARWWLRQMKTFFDRTDLKWEESATQLTAIGTDREGRTVTAIVDRKTLTVREFSVTDVRTVVFTLKFSVYQMFTNTLGFEQDWPKYGQVTPDAIPPREIAWPTHIEAISSRGTIIIDLHDVTLNTELPKEAFQPPSRATRLP
jgi:outer membrane lipoprotein-sorting protein